MPPAQCTTKIGIAGLTVMCCLGTASCALWPGWHWEKPGATEAMLEWDQTQCKAKVYAGNMGEVTNETVRKMFACMEGKGWSRQRN